MFVKPDSTPATAVRYVCEVLLFAVCYILADSASFIEPLGRFNITPWNPQPALAIVWMAKRGIVQWPVVFATLVLADILVRGAPAGYAVTGGSSFVLAAGYAAIALVLSRGLKYRRLHSTRDLVFFTGTIVIGAAIVGAAYVNVLSVAGLLRGVSTSEAWLRFWLGDAVGILITGSLLLAITDPERRLGALLRQPESWLQWATLCALLWLVFHGLPHEITAPFYVLFVPLIWIAMRSGMNGVIISMVIVQLGVLVGVHNGSGPHLSIVEIQFLVCILCVTALFHGMVIDERQRAEARTQRK